MTVTKELTPTGLHHEQRVPMSYEAFLAAADEDTHAEWVNGEAIFFIPPNSIHQDIAGFLYALLRPYIKFFQLGADKKRAKFEQNVGWWWNRPSGYALASDGAQIAVGFQKTATRTGECNRALLAADRDRFTQRVARRDAVTDGDEGGKPWPNTHSPPSGGWKRRSPPSGPPSSKLNAGRNGGAGSSR